MLGWEAMDKSSHTENCQQYGSCMVCSRRDALVYGRVQLQLLEILSSKPTSSWAQIKSSQQQLVLTILDFLPTCFNACDLRYIIRISHVTCSTNYRVFQLHLPMALPIDSCTLLWCRCMIKMHICFKLVTWLSAMSLGLRLCTSRKGGTWDSKLQKSMNYRSYLCDHLCRPHIMSLRVEA